ncbi:hypothetical protein L1987_09462 [Smallanthus sonchifolius]|uniref:Uncharacterized protein n=1 Tax=Smallanthus sonchifolius TaxID=185202 RepID=A0ACB9JNH2_9ASTR|nr:hypothetical protein L1987_09462 [Smallanthus sonchifolius]
MAMIFVNPTCQTLASSGWCVPWGYLAEIEGLLVQIIQVKAILLRTLVLCVAYYVCWGFYLHSSYLL